MNRRQSRQRQHAVKLKEKRQRKHVAKFSYACGVAIRGANYVVDQIVEAFAGRVK